MAEQAGKLKQVRGATRSVATRYENEALRLIEQPEQCSEAQICRLETIEHLLETKLESLRILDQQILERWRN